MLFFTCIFHLTFIFVVVNHHHRNKRVANSTCPSTPLAHSHPHPHGSSASRTRYGQPPPERREVYHAWGSISTFHISSHCRSGRLV